MAPDIYLDAPHPSLFMDAEGWLSLQPRLTLFPRLNISAGAAPTLNAGAMHLG